MCACFVMLHSVYRSKNRVASKKCQVILRLKKGFRFSFFANCSKHREGDTREAGSAPAQLSACQCMQVRRVQELAKLNPETLLASIVPNGG